MAGANGQRVAEPRINSYLLVICQHQPSSSSAQQLMIGKSELIVSRILASVGATVVIVRVLATISQNNDHNLSCILYVPTRPRRGCPRSV